MLCNAVKGLLVFGADKNVAVNGVGALRWMAFPALVMTISDEGGWLARFSST
jgi:hypothetical protein